MGLHPQLLPYYGVPFAHPVVCPLGENKRSLGVTPTSIFADERSDNMVSTHTCVHPQHVKVVIDLRYVQH